MPSHAAQAAVEFVQSASRIQTTASIQVSFASNVQVSNVIAVAVGWFSQSVTLNSITDNCGAGGASNTYTIVDNPTTHNNLSRAAMAYAVIGKSGACTVTAAFSGSQSDSIIVHELSGVNVATPLDGHKLNMQTDPGTGTDAVSNGNFATHNADYIFGFAYDAEGAAPTITAGTGFTSRESPTGVGAMQSEDKIQSAAGQVKVTFTSSAPVDYITGVMAFLPAGGYQVSSRSDTLSDSRPSASSNQTISFTTNTQITGSSTITLMFPTGFTLPVDCGDMDAATSSQFNFNYGSCAPTVTAWGAAVSHAATSNFVQQNASQATGAPTTKTVPFNTNVSSGNLVVIAAAWDGSADVQSVTDTLANVYTAVGPKKTGIGTLATWNTQVFYAKNITGGTNSVTVKLSAAATNEILVYIHEYSGADTSSPLDVTSSNALSGATPGGSGSAATRFTNELIFGFELDGAIGYGPGSDFTARSSFLTNVTEDRVVAGIGTYEATFDSISDRIMYMATFRLTSPGLMLTLTAPTDSTSTVHVATSTQITIKIGSNATVGRQGGHWITNPSTGGAYTISVGGTFGGSGNILVSINSGVTVQATVAESLAFTVSSVSPSFPSTGILDNFNRSDEDPLANGTWACPIQSGHGDLQVLTNQVTDSGFGNSDCYWSASTFGPNSEAFVTVATPPLNGQCVAIQLRLNNLNSASLNGYWYEYCAVVGAGNDTFTVFRIDNDTLSIIAAGTQEVSSGDSIGAGAIGSTLKMYYKASAGSWTQIVSVVDGTYVGSGRIGLHIEQNQARADDFGGGTAVSCPADDGATVNSVDATATSVPFGIISPNTFYQGCQDLIVSTNAGNGYSVTVQERSAMKTLDGRFSIPDTTCDGGTCTESVAAAWTNATKNGLGHTCFDYVNHDCNAAYSSGTNFRQAADISAGETAQAVMSSSTAATATGRLKFRLSTGSAQAAGAYTTIITYIITGTY